MSKHCEVCDRTYPDDLDACPHCAAALEVSEADVIELGADALDVVEEDAVEVVGEAEPVAAFGDGPDSAVDLGLPAVPTDPNGNSSHQSGSGSGLSVIEWASLVEEGPEPAAPAAAAFDDPADADLIGHAPAASAEAPPSPPITEPTLVLPPVPESEDALASDLEAVRSIFAGDASASFARRNPAQPAVPEPAGDADDSALNLSSPAGEGLHPMAGGSDSNINLGAPLVEAGSGSQQMVEPAAPVIGGSDADVDLGAVPEAESTSHVEIGPEALETVDSGIDLASADLEEQVVAEAIGTPPEQTPSDSGIDLSWAETAVPPAEVLFVDSGVGLPGPEVVDVAPPSRPAEEAVVRPISDAGIDLSGVEPTGPDSGPQAGIEKDTPSTSDSGVDRIAEEVESGLNLPPETFDFVGDSKVGSGAGKVDEIIVDESATALTAGQLPSGEEEVDLTERTADVVDSSAVDLGASSATFPVAPPAPPAGPDDAEATRPYEAESKSIHGEEEASPSEVDLGARRAGDSSRDFFEPSEALSEAPERSAVVDESATDLPVVDEESAIAMGDELEPVAVEEERAVSEEEPVEEEAPTPPAKKEKRRSTAGAWVGGVVLGGVVTVGVLLVLWLFNIEPPREWRGFVPGGNASVGPNGPAPQAQAPSPMTFAERAALIHSGDLDRAAKAGVESADESKADELAARGEYRVRKYLADQSQGKAPIKADDEALKKGEADLDKVKDSDKSGDALFWLGVANEATGDSKSLKEAEKLYQEGWDHTKQQRFKDALNRLSAKTEAKAAGMGRAAPTLDPALLVLIVTGLAAEQPPQAPQPPPVEQPPSEAGSAFWEAAKLAQDGKYDDAGKTLQAAIDRHKARRFGLLGKAQNPNSDPTEEIFVRSCQELQRYYAMREALQNSKLPVVKGADPATDVAELVKEDKKRTADLDQAATEAKALNDKLTKADADLTETNDKLQKAATALDDTKKKLTDADKDLTTTKEALAASAKKADGLAADLNTAKETITKKNETLKGVADALTAANALKPGDGEAAVVPAVKEILQSKEAQGTAKIVRALKDERDVLKNERDGLRTALKDSRRPEQMLSLWLPLLRDRGRTDLADEAILDAERVLKADAASPADRGRAHAVKGLALRNQGKYDEAKTELEKAKTDLPKGEGEWQLETDSALLEAAHPAAYFTLMAGQYRAEGRNAQALAMLNRALESAAPAARAGLLVERGTVRLDAALTRGKGQVAAADPDLAAAQKDAEAAKKDGAAGAFYLAGRIDEAQGNLDAAVNDYRRAYAAHGAADADGFRYETALARVLMLKPHEGAGQADPDVTEALKLAGEVLSARSDEVPFEARAEALAVEGLWTDALNAYVEGIRPHISPERAAVLLAVVQGHPALHRPTIMTVADPLEAVKHYAAGLQWYNDHEYDKAEKEFFTAVEHDGQDARYYYYLGLSRLLQGDRDAYEDFEQGARLERKDRPARAAVSAALERVQGEPRERLNAIRDRPQ